MLRRQRLLRRLTKIKEQFEDSDSNKKKCVDCKNDKTKDYFSKTSWKKGKQSVCKDCQSARNDKNARDLKLKSKTGNNNTAHIQRSNKDTKDKSANSKLLEKQLNLEKAIIKEKEEKIKKTFGRN